MFVKEREGVRERLVRLVWCGTAAQERGKRKVELNSYPSLITRHHNSSSSTSVADSRTSTKKESPLTSRHMGTLWRGRGGERLECHELCEVGSALYAAHIHMKRGWHGSNRGAAAARNSPLRLHRFPFTQKLTPNAL